MSQRTPAIIHARDDHDLDKGVGICWNWNQQGSLLHWMWGVRERDESRMTAGFVA